MVIGKSKRTHGIKRPFKLEEIWRIRTRLELEDNLMELARLNLAIDSKLRSCDLLNLKVQDVGTQRWYDTILGGDYTPSLAKL